MRKCSLFLLALTPLIAQLDRIPPPNTASPLARASGVPVPGIAEEGEALSFGKAGCLELGLQPHEQVRRSDAEHYRSRCQTCHTTGAHTQAQTDWIGCHMPPVPAGAHLWRGSRE